MIAAIAAPRANADAEARGGPVALTRLQTSSPLWSRHRETDRSWIYALRTSTSANIEPSAQVAAASDLDQLCRQPLVLAANMTQLSPGERANLREYLARGGFVVLDACLNASATPDYDAYIAREVALLTEMFPNARTEILPPSHPVFSIVYQMREFPPQARQSLAEPVKPLRAVYVDQRMIAMISLSGFECGLAGFGRLASSTDTAEMLVNIYVYAMMR